MIPNEERIANALEKIADILEKQNAGNDEEFKLRVFAAISQGIPATIISDAVITGGYITTGGPVEKFRRS